MTARADYYSNSSAQLSPALAAKDPRWHAWRSNAQSFTPPGHSRPLLSVFTVETIPWMATYRNQAGLSWAGLTPPVYAGDTPVAGLGAAPAVNGSSAPACGWCATCTCLDGPTWAAWENAQLAQLEDWLRTDTAPWRIVTGHVQVQDDNAGDTPELARIQALLSKYNVPLYINGHDHTLQMTRRGPAGNTTTYVVNGAGGLNSGGVRLFASTLFASNNLGFLAINVTTTRM